MATCPSGHESASDDFCDVCGFRIGAPGIVIDPALAGADFGNAAAPADAGDCPRCGAPRVGQFCEACGFDFTTGGAPVPPPTMSLPATVQSATPPPATPPPATRPRPRRGSPRPRRGSRGPPW